MLFGSRTQSGTPPFAVGQSTLDAYGGPSEPMAKPKRGLFGSGISLGQIAGAAGDALSVYGGGPAIYAQRVEQQRQERQQAQLAEAQRAAGLEDFRIKQQIEQEFRPAPQPHRWESNDGSLMELGPDGQLRIAYADPTPKMNFIPDGRGGGQWVAVPTSAPTAPISTPELPPGYSIRGGQPAGTAPFGL
jgi:hypothetical protein